MTDTTQTTTYCGANDPTLPLIDETDNLLITGKTVSFTNPTKSLVDGRDKPVVTRPIKPFKLDVIGRNKCETKRDNSDPTLPLVYQANKQVNNKRIFSAIYPTKPLVNDLVSLDKLVITRDEPFKSAVNRSSVERDKHAGSGEPLLSLSLYSTNLLVACDTDKQLNNRSKPWLFKSR